MAERCDLTELLVDQCAHCLGTPDMLAPNPHANRPQTSARYAGWCAGCGEAFGQGDLITSNGTGGWLAECCGVDHD